MLVFFIVILFWCVIHNNGDGKDVHIFPSGKLVSAFERSQLQLISVKKCPIKVPNKLTTVPYI